MKPAANQKRRKEPKRKPNVKAERRSGAFVPFGVTDFTIRGYKANPETFAPEPSSSFLAPIESIKNLRVDVAPGVVTNPQAVPKCCGFRTSPRLGSPWPKGSSLKHRNARKARSSANRRSRPILETSPLDPKKFEDKELLGKVYNLEQEARAGLDIRGRARSSGGGLYVHTIIKGSVEYASDYHDYFVINNISPGLMESRLVFYGAKIQKSPDEKTEFIRNGTKCAAVGPETTTTVRGEFEAGSQNQNARTPASWAASGAEASSSNPRFGLTPEIGRDRRARRDHDRNERHPPVGRPRTGHGRPGNDLGQIARRHDDQPVGRGVARRLHAGTGRHATNRAPRSKSLRTAPDRLPLRQQDRNRQPRSADAARRGSCRARSSSASRRADRSRPALHDLPGSGIDALRPAGTAERHRRTEPGDRAADGDGQRKPAGAIQQRQGALQRGRVRADRQPARVRQQQRADLAFAAFSGNGVPRSADVRSRRSAAPPRRRRSHPARAPRRCRRSAARRPT